jgi:hypothetical protein
MKGKKQRQKSCQFTIYKNTVKSCPWHSFWTTYSSKQCYINESDLRLSSNCLYLSKLKVFQDNLVPRVILISLYSFIKPKIHCLLCNNMITVLCCNTTQGMPLRVTAAYCMVQSLDTHTSPFKRTLVIYIYLPPHISI